MVLIGSFGHPAMNEDKYRNLTENTPVDPLLSGCGLAQLSPSSIRCVPYVLLVSPPGEFVRENRVPADF